MNSYGKINRRKAVQMKQCECNFCNTEYFREKPMKQTLTLIEIKDVYIQTKDDCP
jgi:hypothetical protein